MIEDCCLNGFVHLLETGFKIQMKIYYIDEYAWACDVNKPSVFWSVIFDSKWSSVSVIQ